MSEYPFIRIPEHGADALKALIEDIRRVNPEFLPDDRQWDIEELQQTNSSLPRSWFEKMIAYQDERLARAEVEREFKEAEARVQEETDEEGEEQKAA